jgi:RNA recognition motif-containing protein
MKLIILNLPRDYTENELAALFKQYGNIKACDLVMDKVTGDSKGFGFVEMALKEEAVVAIEALNGMTIDKKKIRVKAANQP